jgi:hypothetical protein
VQTQAVWPVNAQKISFCGETVWILPVMVDRFPAVAMKMPPDKSRAECERLLLRFLSTLSWVEGQGYLVEGFGGGGLLNPMGRNKEFGYSICQEFDLSYFPETSVQRAMLALALMREGRGLNHPGHSFLSLFRILEVALGRGRSPQITWINEKIDAGLRDYRAKSVLDALRKQGITDTGAHLYESGRCAIAHASGEPVIDPDDPADARRLWSERPLILALAELAIEEVFGVESSQTQYSKHLYELDGFKRILGDTVIGHLVRGDNPPDELTVQVPNISVQLRTKPPFAPLSNLELKFMTREQHSLGMLFSSTDGLTNFRVKLDFANERLHFNLFEDIGYADSGSADSAEAMVEILRFHHEYFGNGQLRLLNAETGKLISRKDAYLPLNMVFDPQAANAEVNRWKEVAKFRRSIEQRFASELTRLSKGYTVKILFTPSESFSFQ